MLWALDNLMNPWDEFRRLQREMNNLFNDYLGEREAFPAVNIWKSKDNIILTAELPGINPDDVDITVTGNQLSIAGELKPELPEGDDIVYHRVEREGGKFVRSFRLPMEVDANKVEASYKDGVLAIRLPIKESEKPKRITIRSK